MGPNAKQDNAEVIDGITVDFWVFTKSDPDPDPDLKPFSFGTGTLRVGVTPDDSNTPVFYEVITPERTVRLHFLNFRTAFRAKPNLFKVPAGAPSKRSLAPAGRSSAGRPTPELNRVLRAARPQPLCPSQRERR